MGKLVYVQEIGFRKRLTEVYIDGKPLSETERLNYEEKK